MNKTFTRKVINNKKYQFLTLPGTNLFKFELVNLYGSNIERVLEKQLNKNVYGISHFIEHLGFRAPKDYTTDELMKLIKEEGSYNASTNHDRINYWFKTTSDRKDLAIRLVCNYALNTLENIPEDEFELEKKVVYNEAKRYADDDQTMFYFNMTSTACGYHAEDNIIGIPETIDTFTHEDTIKVKQIMLENGQEVFNVTYDPTVLNEEDIVKSIEAEYERFDKPSKVENAIDEQYHGNLTNPRVGEFKVDNESEQAMTGIYFDVIDQVTADIFTARIGNAYLSRYSKTSLTDIIREKNGLTYGVSFGDDTVGYNPYTYFACDVSRGDEEKLITLMKSSINQSVEEFTEEKHKELIETIQLQRTLKYLNLGNYDGIFWIGIWYPYIFSSDNAGPLFEDDIDAAFKMMDATSSNYENIKRYIEKINDKVQKEEWTKIYS